MTRSLQINLPPMEAMNVDHRNSMRETAVDQGLALLRKAVADCGYTLDALQSAMDKDRAYIHKVLQGEKPLSFEFITALPDDVEGRFETLRAKQFGRIVVEPVAGEAAIEQLVSGLVGVLGGRVRGAV